MNNNEKFTRLRRLFTEYEALKSEKNLRIYDIQNLSIPGGLKENCIKEYKAFVDPLLGKVEDNIMKILDDKAITCVLNREDAIRYAKDKEYYEFNFDTYKIVLDADMFKEVYYKCSYTDLDCNNCVLNDIPCICNELQGKYTRGEYHIIKSKEE